MLMVAAFLLGTISYRSMRVELNPEVSFGTITITTAYPGASPDDINQLISRRLEEAVSGVNGVREVTSTSQEGVSNVVVTLELSVNVDAALNDVRSKIDSVTNLLPKDALKPTVSKFDNSAQPVLYLAFASDKMNSKQLRDLMDDKLTDRFAQIPGVASATVQGGDVREIDVQVSRDKLVYYGLGIIDIQKAVANSSLDAPSGKLNLGPQEYTVRVKSTFTDAEQIKRMVISVTDPKDPNAPPRTVKLSDVANVTDTVKERTSYARLNGNDSIILAIQKARDGNAVEITKTADGVIASIQKEYASSNIKVIKTLEQAKQIQESLADLNFSLLFGIFLVSAIVFVFLHNLRGTIIVALAIPTSIFATFVAMNMLGFTINNMSMLSLSLAIGVLVDDAIVVLENIYRHLKMGEDPRDAAINGRGEIGLAALAITFADVVVFLPIGFMGGIVGQFFKPLALGFVCATLFSLFVSFTLTPLLASRWYRAGEDMEHPSGAFAKWFERRFGKLEKSYRRGLEWALNHRWFVFIAGNVVLFGIFMFIAGSFTPSAIPPGTPEAAAKAMKIGIPGAVAAGMGLFPMAIILGIITTVVNLIRHRKFRVKYILAAVAFGLVFPVASVVGYEYAQWKKEAVFKFGFLPDTDSGQIQANIELPPGSSLDATQQIVTQVEKEMAKDPDVKYVISNVGSQGAGSLGASNQGSNYAQVQATLYDKQSFTDRFRKHEERLRTRSSDSVAADLTARFGRVAGGSVKISAVSGFAFGSAIQLSLTSDDRDLLVKTAVAVRDELAKGNIKGVINPDISTKPGKPELQIFPDRVAAGDQGINPTDIGNAVRTLYQGNNDTKLRVNGREYDIRVMMSRKDRDNPNILSTVPITFKQGNPIYLSSVGDIHQEPGINRVTRRARAEEITVTADLLPGYANGTVQAQITSWMKDHNLVPAGVNYRPLGQADAQAREMGFLFGAMGIGLVLVYMLLASLYDNLLYPFIIQIAQPQAMVGAILALVLTDKSLNLVGFIGIICLIGLVGKNAILVVDYANTLRDRGRNRHDALAEAGPTRLRPILMTTMALILAMLPVAMAIGRGSEFRETIGITIIGGISLSTMLTLFVIPCSYTIFDDLSIQIGKLQKWLFRRGDDGDGEVDPTEAESGIEAPPLQV